MQWLFGLIFLTKTILKFTNENSISRELCIINDSSCTILIRPVSQQFIDDSLVTTSSRIHMPYLLCFEFGSSGSPACIRSRSSSVIVSIICWMPEIGTTLSPFLMCDEIQNRGSVRNMLKFKKNRILEKIFTSEKCWLNFKSRSVLVNHFDDPRTTVFIVISFYGVIFNLRLHLLHFVF